MCNEAVHMYPYLLEYVPDHFKSKAVEKGLWLLIHVPDHLRIKKFVTRQWEMTLSFCLMFLIGLWHINKYKEVCDQKLLDDTLRKLAWDGLQKIVVMYGDTIIDRRTGEVLDPGADFTYRKEKF